MKIDSIFEDSYAKSFFKLTCASIPFTTVGMLGEKTTLYVSAAVGALALLAIIVRIAMFLTGKTAAVENTAFSHDVDDMLALPYALALSSSIAGMMGYSVKPGLWLAAMLCILLIISNHVKKRA